MTRHRQRGGFALGLVAGLLVGLALALGVALYITKAPVPFLNKVPQRTALQDTAETERNRSWDPNAPLGTRPAPRVVPAVPPDAAASALAGTPVPQLPLPPGIAPAVGPARDPAAILAGSTPTVPARTPVAIADPFEYLVQVGAYSRADDAENQRAKLALMGMPARVTEREQGGRTVYRVRLGPYAARNEADVLQEKLQEQSIEAQIVRVERR